MVVTLHPGKKKTLNLGKLISISPKPEGDLGGIPLLNHRLR